MSIQFEPFTPEDVELQRDIIKSYLIKETAPWLIAKAQAERAGGNSASLNIERGRLMGILDVMLEELHELDHPEAYDGTQS